MGLLGGILNAGANIASAALGAGGAKGMAAVDVKSSINDFANMVPEIDFNKIVREPKTSFKRVGEVSATKAAEDTLTFNIDKAIPALIPAAQKITAGLVDSVQAGMEDVFPGFQENVAKLSENIASRQRGELSVGAQRSIARNLVSSAPLRKLGPESFQNAFGGYVGLSSEDLTQQGDTMMLQATPTFRNIFRVTGADELMQYGGLSTGQTLQARLQEASRMQQALQFDVSTRLEKDLNMANLTVNDRNFRYNFGLQATNLMINQAAQVAQSGLQANAQRSGMINDAMESIGSGFGASYEQGRTSVSVGNANQPARAESVSLNRPNSILNIAPIWKR
jgi:hypothetical protein